MITATAPQNCSGCRLCALACSFHNGPRQEFSLAAASVRVERVAHENAFRPRFLKSCTGCGLCLPYCAYGVLAEE